MLFRSAFSLEAVLLYEQGDPLAAAAYVAGSVVFSIGALFAALALDGRAPYADIAAASSYSETTVRRRMDQLRDQGVLYFDLEMDMPSFGFRSSAWLWLSVPPSHLADAGTALAKFPEVAYVTATTGPANLAACVVCTDEESLYEFLTAKVGALPGVERVETAPIIRTVKQASPVMAPRL